MNKKTFIIIIILILLIGGGMIWYFSKNNEKVVLDSERFANEYEMIDKNNVFVYNDINEIIKILEHGTGVVYLGFPECPWCKAYVVYLNEVAKEKDAESIHYYNVLEDRKNNTDNYKKIVEILSDYLQYDDEGNKRLYVPAVIAVNKGQIVGFDDETAWDTKGYETPEEYWENENLSSLKEKLGNMFENTKNNICTSNCNK